MCKHKKIMILYITERSGHHSAALALKRAFELKEPLCSVVCINAFRYAFPFVERLIHVLYLAVIKRVPSIWGRMYDNPKLVKRCRGIKDWVHSIAIKRMNDLIHRFKPDIVVCTQAFPCGIVAEYKNNLPVKNRLSLIGVLTDFSPHAFWVYENVDYYMVACDESREMLHKRGVGYEKIKVFGIPIDPKFSINQDRSELLANFGFKDTLPIIMIMGGGHGLGPIKDIIYELDIAKETYQIIVVCGINIQLYNWLQNTRFKNIIRSFKYTDQIDKLMTLADVIISKPGGITTAEALAKKIPMVILNPIPGQETRNADFLIDKGAAVKIEQPQEIANLLKSLFETSRSKRFLNSFLKGSLELSKPNSSCDIADFILKL